MPGPNRLAVDSEILFIGSLTKTALVAGATTALGGAVTIRANTTWKVVRKQAHLGNDVLAQAAFLLVDANGNEFDRLACNAPATPPAAPFPGTNVVREDERGTGRLITFTSDTTIQCNVSGGVASSGQLSVAGGFTLRQVPHPS